MDHILAVFGAVSTLLMGIVAFVLHQQNKGLKKDNARLRVTGENQAIDEYLRGLEAEVEKRKSDYEKARTITITDKHGNS